MLPGLSATTGLGPISYPGVTIHTVTHLPPVPNSGPSLSFLQLRRKELGALVITLLPPLL